MDFHGDYFSHISDKTLFIYKCFLNKYNNNTAARSGTHKLCQRSWQVEFGRQHNLNDQSQTICNVIYQYL